MAEEEQEVTLEQATEALLELNTSAGASGGDDEVAPVTEQPAQETEPAPELQAAEESTGTDEVLQEAAPEEPSADVQAMEQRFTDRLEATKQRYEANQRILQDRYLRKSTEGDRVARALESALADDGLDRDEARRLLGQYRGTMNPASPSYAPPAQQPQPQYQQQYQPQQQQGAEDQEMVFNDFLNDKGMTAGEAGEFGTWIRTDAQNVMPQAEQAVASQSLDGFLRLAHGRWEGVQRDADKAARTNDAVGAVRSVQRTQRAAAKAASSAPVAPTKQAPRPAAEVDTSKLTNADLSSLFRQSVEQYK